MNANIIADIIEFENLFTIDVTYIENHIFVKFIYPIKGKRTFSIFSLAWENL